MHVDNQEGGEQHDTPKRREEGAGDKTSNISVSQSAPSHAIQLHSRDLDIGNNEASWRALAAAAVEGG
jgi:hypothetical protein